MQNYKAIIKLLKHRIKLNKNNQYFFIKDFGGYAHWSDTTDYAEQESLFAIETELFSLLETVKNLYKNKERTNKIM